MTDGLSASDVMALTRDEGGAWNNPFIYLVWLALLGNGNFLGRNNYGGGGIYENYTLNSDFASLSRQIDSATQSLERKGDSISNGLCDGFYAMNTGILNGFANTAATINNTGYQVQSQIASLASDLAKCCCENQRAIDGVKFENAQNTTAITNAIHAEAEATRALITQNTMQELRDKLAEKDRDLLMANNMISQQAQTANIVGTLRPFPQPAYITCSPYQTANNTCGVC